MAQEIESILKALGSLRPAYAREGILQQSVASCLEGAGIAFEREKKIAESCRPDFLCGEIAIEVKVRGGSGSAFNQCMKYARVDCVSEVVLVTARPMSSPTRTLNGKPFHLVNIWRNGI